MRQGFVPGFGPSMFQVTISDSGTRYSKGPSGNGQAVSTGEEVLAEAARRWAKTQYANLALIAAVVCALVGLWRPWFFAYVLVLLAAAWKLDDSDRARRQVTLHYDLDPASRTAYFQMYNLFVTLAPAKKLWWVFDHYFGLRVRQMLRLGDSQILACNLPVARLINGNISLFFLPDRLLVLTGRRLQEVDYSALRVHTDSAQYREKGETPSDALHVGTGIVEFGLLQFTAPQAVDLTLVVSNRSLLSGAREAFRLMGVSAEERARHQAAETALFDRGKLKMVGLWTDDPRQEMSRFLYRFGRLRLRESRLMLEWDPAPDDSDAVAEESRPVRVAIGSGPERSPQVPLIDPQNEMVTVTLYREGGDQERAFTTACYFEARPAVVDRFLEKAAAQAG